MDRIPRPPEAFFEGTPPAVRVYIELLHDALDRLHQRVEVEGVEPTNNNAERVLRQAVIWRKLSFGTQSSDGSRFVERMRTVVETCCRQKRDVFAWMIEAVDAHFHGKPTPSLMLRM
jgi:transposase